MSNRQRPDYASRAIGQAFRQGNVLEGCKIRTQ